VAIKKTKITDVLQELGLPESSVFCGYVVHLPEEDEFLAVVRESAAMIHRGFSKTPETAKIYQDYKKALKEAKHCKQETIVCLLFDVENQFIIAPIEE
jgi:hypothetical protein